MSVTVSAVNGRAGLVSRDGTGHPLAVMAVGVDGGRIVRLWAIRNPEKLRAYATEEPRSRRANRRRAIPDRPEKAPAPNLVTETNDAPHDHHDRFDR